MAKNWLLFEMCRVAYLLLLTTMALMTSGEYVTSIPRSGTWYQCNSSDLSRFCCFCLSLSLNGGTLYTPF